VLYAPGVSTAAEIGEICRNVDKPVNVIGGLGKTPLTVCELAELGVRRISHGSLLHSAAMTAFVNAAQDESFGWVADLVGGQQLDQWLEEGAG
jgi:2-methylisocitrate lyase-like PEP mutase family enzyme